MSTTIYSLFGRPWIKVNKEKHKDFKETTAFTEYKYSLLNIDLDATGLLEVLNIYFNNFICDCKSNDLLFSFFKINHEEGRVELSEQDYSNPLWNKIYINLKYIEYKFKIFENEDFKKHKECLTFSLAIAGGFYFKLKNNHSLAKEFLDYAITLNSKNYLPYTLLASLDNYSAIYEEHINAKAAYFLKQNIYNTFQLYKVLIKRYKDGRVEDAEIKAILKFEKNLTATKALNDCFYFYKALYHELTKDYLLAARMYYKSLVANKKELYFLLCYINCLVFLQDTVRINRILGKTFYPINLKGNKTNRWHYDLHKQSIFSKLYHYHYAIFDSNSICYYDIDSMNNVYTKFEGIDLFIRNVGFYASIIDELTKFKLLCFEGILTNYRLIFVNPRSTESNFYNHFTYLKEILCSYYDYNKDIDRLENVVENLIHIVSIKYKFNELHNTPLKYLYFPELFLYNENFRFDCYPIPNSEVKKYYNLTKENTVKKYSKQDKLDFGKYRGLTIERVFEIDAIYLINSIIRVHTFCIEKQALLTNKNICTYLDVPYFALGILLNQLKIDADEELTYESSIQGNNAPESFTEEEY